MFKAAYFNHSHLMSFQNISKDTAVQMKFDTGAVATVISLEALTDRKNLQSDEISDLLNLC